jgi:hypothetical protein
MENQLTFYVDGAERELQMDVQNIFNAGYAGKNQKLVQEHIDELAKVGVPAPSTTPTLYPIANYLLTTSEKIQVQHNQTSGEIEYVLLWIDGELYATVGSDHTDRNLENYSVPKSKQACPNIVPTKVWKFEEVKDHWDSLELECWITKNGEKQLYQKGKCGDLMSKVEWETTFNERKVSKDGNVFFSATVNTVGNALIFGDLYEFSITDPVLNRKIVHQYEVEVLPVGIE